MAITESGASEANHVGGTASGASIEPISTDAAEAFLARLDQRGPSTVDVAWAALEDGGMSGVALRSPPQAGRAEAFVAVAPARQRRGIGSALLRALASEASGRGVRHLLATYPTSMAPAVDGLYRATGLLVSRRVANGCITAVLFVPDSH